MASRSRPSRRKRPARRSWWPWLAGLLLVAGLAAVGVLAWSHSRGGRAALLNLGADRLYVDVQNDIESALIPVLPALTPGPAPADASGLAADWPLPAAGADAAVHCRVVAVAPERLWWDVQADVARAVAAAGGQVLWGERLGAGRGSAAADAPDDAHDLLRLDVGVAGHPTHTLLLYHADQKAPRVRWGDAAVTGWDMLANAADAPTVAIVIDDWGYYRNDAARALLELDAPLTLSILPGHAFSRQFALEATPLALPGGAPLTAGAGGDPDAQRARLAAGCPVPLAIAGRGAALPERRREIMLHLPMQPVDYPRTNPGSGAILVGMDAARIDSILAGDLAALPGVRGVNNHMGSAATADAETMQKLMAALKRRGLYFLDSLTTQQSVAYAEARRAGLPALRNRIFLDHDDPSPAVVRQRLTTLVEAARRGGFAVGIGHPKAVTADVLARELPRWQAAGVRFVTISELLALQAAAPGAGD